MSFRISLETARFHTPLRGTSVTAERPIAFHNERAADGTRGIYILQHRDVEQRAFFIPRERIEREAEEALRNGLLDRHNATNAGHTPNESSLVSIEQMLQWDRETYKLPRSYLSSLPTKISTLKITQPNISFWRGVGLASEQGPGAGDPVKFINRSSILCIGEFVEDGNTRTFLADAFGMEELPAITVPLPSWAVSLRGNLRGNSNSVAEQYGTSTPLALARSFMRQLQELEQEMEQSATQAVA